MQWKKTTFIVAGLGLLILIMIGVSNEYGEYQKEKELFDELQAQVLDLERENKEIEKDVEYYADPYNLEKELRARFNYKSPGEELLIVVPKEN